MTENDMRLFNEIARCLKDMNVVVWTVTIKYVYSSISTLVSAQAFIDEYREKKTTKSSEMGWFCTRIAKPT